MAKILISSLGVGPDNRQNALDRDYSKALYQMSDGKQYETNFIASALYQHLQLDGIIFIGTVKSMWERVYKVFNGNVEDEDWLNLGVQIENLDLNSSVESLDLSAVERVLGERSKCIVIKYGLNEAEIQENLDLILKIVDYLEAGDELYIDITHSFRSLSIFLFIVLIFLNDLEQERNIKIKGVFYGMLEAGRELGYAPVVDLRSLFDLTQWIKGAYSLKEFGNGYLISQLLNEKGETELANRIEALSEAININYVPTIRDRSIDLKSALKSQGLSSPFKYLRNILEKFTQQFSNRSEAESDFQLKLAGWYFDNKRYATGYITLTEAIITYVCEINEYEGDNLLCKKIREEMRNSLHQDGNKESDLAQLFFKVNPIRKRIAHASMIDEAKKSRQYKRESNRHPKNKNTANYESAIDCASQYHETAKAIFKTGTLNARR